MNLIPIRSRVLRTAALIILIAALVLLLVDVPAAVEAALATDWSEWAVGVFFLILAYALLPLRTRFLVDGEAGYKEALYADAGGFMFTILMQIPNAPFRALALNRSAGVDAGTTTSALTLEILSGWLVRGLAFAMAVAFFAADARDAQRPLLNSILLVSALFILLLILARNSQRVQNLLGSILVYVPRIDDDRASTIAVKTGDALQQMASVRRFGLAFLMTLLIWLASFAFYFFSFESMNLETDNAALLIALAALVVAPPTSPMMIGVFHGAVIAILGTLRLLEVDDAAGYALTLHLIQIIIILIVGFIGLRKMNLNFRTMLRELRDRQAPENESRNVT